MLPLLAAARRLEAGRVNAARDAIDGAVRFLAVRGKVLAELAQRDVYAWFTEAANPSVALAYLVFAIAQRRCAKLTLPPSRRVVSPGTPLPRLREIVARLLEDETIELADRWRACSCCSSRKA